MDLIDKCISLLNKALNPIPQELNELDWKIGLTEKNDRFSKHFSAFANFSGGGFIVFGIDDKTGKVEGLNEKDVNGISEKLANISRDLLDPKICTEFFSFFYCGKTLLGCYVNEAKDRPVYVLKNGKIETPYIRAGGTSRPMHRDEARAAMFSSRPQRYEEIPAVLDAHIENSWADYFDFSQILERLKRTTFSSQDSLYEFLFERKLLAKVGGKYIPTNLGVITCAKDFSLLAGYERLEIRLLVYSGLNNMNAVNDKSYLAGYSLSPDEIVSDIIAYLPHNEIIEQATRKTLPVIHPIALRELISNAIIHRDFTKNSSRIVIEIYDDRVEITNPGSLLEGIEVDRLIDHPSQTRNEVLADLMRKLGFAEERGSGIDKVVQACELFALPAPKFLNEHDYFRAIIYRPKDYADMDKEERVNTVYQHSCLNYVTSRKTTNKSLRERFKFSQKESTKVSRLIKDAVASGKIKLANPDAIRKNFNYVPYWV